MHFSFTSAKHDKTKMFSLRTKIQIETHLPTQKMFLDTSKNSSFRWESRDGFKNVIMDSILMTRAFFLESGFYVFWNKQLLILKQHY